MCRCGDVQGATCHKIITNGSTHHSKLTKNQTRMPLTHTPKSPTFANIMLKWPCDASMHPQRAHENITLHRFCTAVLLDMDAPKPPPHCRLLELSCCLLGLEDARTQYEHYPSCQKGSVQSRQAERPRCTALGLTTPFLRANGSV